MNKFFEGMFVGFVFLILLLSSPGIAFALENESNTPFNENTNNLFFEEEPVVPIISTIPQTSENTSSQTQSISCEPIELTPKEAKEIMNLKSDNFEGETISSGVDTNDGVKTDLEGLNLVGKANDGKTAVTQQPPSKSTSADKYAFLDKRTLNGPFGIGLILDDTLRVGRCVGIDQELCQIYGGGLYYRTDGTTGFSSVFTDMSGAFNDFKAQGIAGLSEEEYLRMQNQVLEVDSFKASTAKANLSDNKMQNVLETNQYIAKNATNCNNSACMVSTYSLFDKQYNSWFSTEFVVSSFGPTLLHSASKAFGFLKIGPGGATLFGPKTSAFLSKKIDNAKYFLDEITSGGAFVGRQRIGRYQSLHKQYGLGEQFNDLTIGKKAFSSGAGGKVDDLLGPNGSLGKLSPEAKEAFYKATTDLKSYAYASSQRMEALKEIYQKSAKTTDDLISYAKGVAKEINAWDDDTFLDFVQWIQQNGDLTGLQGLAIKKVGFGDSGIIDITTGETFNFKKALLQPFQKTGGWDSFVGASTHVENAVEVATDPATGRVGVQLFKLAPQKAVGAPVPLADLEGYLSKIGPGVYSVQVGAEVLPLNQASVNYIKGLAASPPTVQILDSKYVADKVLYPEEFANILTQGRPVGRPGTAFTNLENIELTLRGRPEFTSRRTYNMLDAAFAKEKSLISDYYYLKASSSGFAKALIAPTAVWNIKRGLGNESFSAYQIPDTWTTMTISQGTDDIYRDSYIDFYANAGSDQGDLFAKVINNAVFFPNEVLDVLVEKLPAFEETYNSITGEGGLGKKSIMRDEVKNIAFYSHNENCSGCITNIMQEDGYLKFGINAPTEIKSFLVEAVDSDTAKEEGAALVAYTHHSNLKGATRDIEGEEINLVEARKEGLTCDQKLRDAGLGFAGTGGAGLVLAGGESVAYWVNPGFGILATALQQLIIAPKLQDCVDDVEGYYVHFYAPPSTVQNTKKSDEVVSNETVTTALSDLAERVDDLATEGNPVGESLTKIKDEMQDFTDGAKRADLLQSTIEMLPPNSGHLMGDEIFYIWYKDNQISSGLKTEGREITKDGNKEVIEDYENGDLIINGNVVIDDKKEIVGNIIQDNRVPAKIVPRRVNTVDAIDTDEIVFEINTLGEVTVKNNTILECIKAAIKSQTGITYSGSELTQVFGELKLINTENYSNIFVKDRMIQLEGTGDRAKGTAGALFLINGYWNSYLQIDTNSKIEAGKLIGISFEHGSLVINEETNELVIWIRQHKEAVLNTREVAGLNAKIATTIDPETECEQPAIELEALAFPNDALGQQRVNNFNTSMKTVGPFTQFTTDGKIYEFYAKLDPTTGECKDYFRVIDKATGKVLIDSEIVGGITQDDEGKITFKTSDGQTHSLDFDAENGVPKVAYNNGPAETLLTAQGTNGSFWFDPKTGQWYPENGMQIPLNQAFKDQGAYYGTDAQGNVTGVAGNPITFNNVQQAGSGFNIPSLPETMSGILLFISLFLITAFYSTQTLQKKKIKK